MSSANRAALGALVAWAAVIVIAGALDPSGLAAPIAWTGAHPAAQSWSLLQYVLYGPLMLLLIWLGAWTFLRGTSLDASRRWIWWQIWLIVVLAVMLSKLIYSAVLLGPDLAEGSSVGLPRATSVPYLVWATGITGVKTLVFGWIPAGVAALLWRPTWSPPPDSEPALAVRVRLTAVVVVAAVALGGMWLADLWWTGSPVGYAYSTDWRSLAPTAGAGWPGQVLALATMWLLLSEALKGLGRRIPPPRPVSAAAVAGATASVVTGLGLAAAQSVVAVVFGTDLGGEGDLWNIPSTYLRLVEGLSFGLLIAPVVIVAVWIFLRRARPGGTEPVLIGALVLTLVVVGISASRYAGLPPLARDPQPVALPPGPRVPSGAPPTAQVDAPLARLTVRRDPDGTAVLADQRGAQVVLRGVNVNQLGEYYPANPDVDTVAPLTEQDFTDIAAMGFDAVRLVLSWSLLQPQPDAADEKYLDRVGRAVAWAGKHGIHVVLDMHQDAWGMSVVAPKGTKCRAGTAPMTGWDGAPKWATYRDGGPPCMFTGRDLAPNVLRAFSSFYADREDVQTQLVATWGRIAERFGADPTVAGYDLLNEPSFAEQAPLTSGPLLGKYHARAIQAIRAGEAHARNGYAHPVFVEPSIWWSGFGIDPLPPRGFTTDPQVVFAPHLYNESITMDQSLGVTFVGIHRGYALAERAAARWGVPLWVGEWGAFGDQQTNRAYYERFMTQVDASRQGSAIWVWKQACGDPHVYPAPEAGNIRRMGCPRGTQLRTRSVELMPVTRAYPRSVPGRLIALESAERSVRIVGSTDGVEEQADALLPCTLDVWVPGKARPRWEVVRGVRSVHAVRVPEGSSTQRPSGGWRVVGCASGSYEIRVRRG